MVSPVAQVNGVVAVDPAVPSAATLSIVKAELKVVNPDLLFAGVLESVI